LAAEPLGRTPNQIRVLDCRGIERDLIGPGLEEGADIIQRPDAAPDRERHESLIGRAGHHVDHDRPPFVGCRDIQEDQLVRPLLVVERRHLNRVARVAEVEEPGSLDHPPFLDVPTGDDPFRQHHDRPAARAASRVNRPS
jgi:hypothetical protein